MRLRPAITAMLFGLAATDARAEWRWSVGTEHFAWSEHTSPLEVRESGLVFALGWSFVPATEGSLRFAYRGRAHVGDVRYDGANLFAQTVAASGTTEYAGTTQEGQVRYRVGHAFDALGAVDLDWWRRKLGALQTEDYRVVSLRVGAERQARARDPWRCGAGLKLTASTREDAHFQDLGFDQDPILTPGRSVTPYAEVGYRFGRRWAVAGSYDGFRFGRSNQVVLTKRRAQSLSYQPASDMRVFGLWLEYGR